MRNVNDKADVHLQELRQTIDQYELLIQSMLKRSRDVPPLTMRSQHHIRPVPIIALCAYKHSNVCYFFTSNNSHHFTFIQFLSLCSVDNRIDIQL